VLGNANNTFVTLERVDLTPMPIDLMVEYTDGSKELFYIPLRIMRGEKTNDQYTNVSRTINADWPWVNPTYSVKIPKSSSSIKRIEIDPSKRMADIDRSNNVFDLQAQMSDTTTTK
jgi:hypothetical protein